MRLLLVIVLLSTVGAAAAQSRRADDGELRRLHQQILRAHLEGSVDDWMRVEADSIVSVHGGQVTFPGLDERRSQRAAYLRDATFSVYRDLREPLVRISDDGTLGWLIAEVEVAGTRAGTDPDAPTPFHDVWAWIELYEKSSEGWRLVGIASSRR